MKINNKREVVLIVEDMLENLQLLTQLLKKQGYEIFSVETGQEALDFIAKQSPDLILLDIVLPDIDGFEVCTRIKNDPLKSSIPIIFISALTKTKDILHGFAVGGVDYITKPFIAEEVLARVSTQFEMSSMRNQLLDQNSELKQLNEEILNQGKAEIQAKVKELKQLTDASFVLLEIDTKEGIYDYIEKFIYPMSGADYLMIVGYDERTKMTFADKIFGIRSIVKSIIPILGKDFMRRKVSTDDWVSRFSLDERKNLYQLDEGLFELTEHTISKSVCLGIEKLMGIEEMFAIGFISYEKYLGGISFGFKKGKQFSNKPLVESIIHQISLALSRIKAKEQLNFSEEKYRSIFENTGNATMIVDDNAHIVLVNEQCVSMTGYTQQQLIGTRWTQYVAPESLEGLKEFSLKRLENKKTINETYEAHLIDVNHEIRIVKLNVGLIPESNNSVVSLLDITDLKRAQKEVVKNEQKYRSIFENIQDVYFETKMDGTIIEVSPSIQLLSKNQYQREDLLGQSLYGFYRSGNGRSALLERLKNGERVHDHEIELINKDGSLLTCSLSANIHFDPIGKFEKISGTFHDITDRKKAEKSMIESEHKYKTLVEKGQVGIGIDDRDGKITYANKQFLDLIGYTEQEVLGKSHEFFLHPDEYERVSAFHKKRIQGNKMPNRYEVKALRKDGEVIYIEIDVTEMIEADGELVGTISYLWDVTEKKLADQALRNSEYRYQTLATISPVGIFRTDANGSTTYVNPTWCEISGLSPEEALGNGWLKRIHPDDKNTLYENWQKSVKNEAVSFSEYRFIRPDDSISWVIGKAVPELDADGKLIGYVGTATDITKHKILESTKEILINISTALLATDSLHDFSSYIFNELGKVIKTNNFYIGLYIEETQMISAPYIKDALDEGIIEFPVGKTMTGYVIKTEKSQLINKERFESLVQAGEIELVGPPSDVWIGVPLFSNEKVIGAIVIQNYDGEKRLDEEDLKILEYAAPQISLAIERKSTFENLKAALEKAQESDRLKSAFLANMSHEIRTPMNGILGFTELLKEPQLSGEQQQEFIEVIERSGARMLNTIRDLIDISTIEAGQVTVMNSETDMRELLHQIESFFKPEIVAKGLQLEFNLPNGENTICFTDSEKMYTILSNLTKNAIKYSKKGKIEIGCDKSQGCIEFYVKDEGIGIPKDMLVSVFDRFVQVDSRLSSDYEGVGLGLSITKAYVEMLGGKIWVESIEGVGSTFYFTIAKNREAETAFKVTTMEHKKGEEMTGKSGGIKLKILLVEDDAMSQQLIKHMLSKMYSEMIMANNGIEALELAKQNPDIDLILMDMKMPDMDGFEATQLIRQFNKEVIIIAQTAYSMLGDREKTLEAGCTDYISKPISKTELIRLLNKYFQK